MTRAGSGGDLAGCCDCPRLAAFLDATRALHPDWHNAPVPAFGDPRARLLVVGLAPGRGGANRSGRPFTGDASGEWLWGALHRLGFASAPHSARGDALVLTGAMVTNAVKCVPPGNKPAPMEIVSCRRHLAAEVAALPELEVVVALGKIAHDAWLAGLRERGIAAKPADHPFAHAALHRFEGGAPPLLDSFHPSPLNTRTGRLTRRAWNAMWNKAATLANGEREKWFVYVGQCGDGSLYTGVTTDIARRAGQHNDGTGAKYTRSRGGITILHVEEAASKSAAHVREWAIKRLTRAQKLALVRKGQPSG